VTRGTLPPGPGSPRAVQTLGWVTRPYPFMERCHRRYGDVFTVKVAQEGTWIFLAHPDAVKQVFTGDPEVFHAGEGNRVLRPVVGEHSVLLLDERPHMVQRKIMLPPFHGERMQRYGELMADIAAEEIQTWPRATTLPVAPSMQAITLEIIVRAVFGVTESERLVPLREALRDLLAFGTKPLAFLLVALLGPDRAARLGPARAAREKVDRLIYDEIARRRSEPDLEQREDILSLLLRARHEDGSAMSDEELHDELMTLLVAGHETTATALSWALERLARHPHALERLREEVDAGEEAYLDAVVKETLRLRPVLPIVVRKLTRPASVAGHDLPAGVTVAPCIYLLHRRPDVYPDPYSFRPERFLEQPAGTYTWIPFGGGVRRCLGASFAQFEMSTVLSVLVRELEVRAPRPERERVSRRAITLTPARGGEIVAHPRSRPARAPAPQTPRAVAATQPAPAPTRPDPSPAVAGAPPEAA